MDARFLSWLSRRLTAFGVDAEVYAPYVWSLLDQGDEEAVRELLGSLAPPQEGSGAEVSHRTKEDPAPKRNA
jgi:hypothetical protein